jgi:hypothetical protein
MLIFLMEACQLILDDCFNLLFHVLLLIFLNFSCWLLRGSSGLVVSAIVRWGSADVCGWLVSCVILRTWPSTTWDERPARSSFSSLFLGGISWVFSRAHKRWAPMLGLDR